MSIFMALPLPPIPHTAYRIVQALQYLLPIVPREIFLLAADVIRGSARAGFQYEALAIGEVVSLVQRVLADHRDIFRDVAGQQINREKRRQRTGEAMNR